MVSRLDDKLLEIVGLSLGVSLSSVAVVGDRRCRSARRSRSPTSRAARRWSSTLNALMGLPSVVVGLAVYLLLSRAGPLGALGILFTPARDGRRAGDPGASR